MVEGTEVCEYRVLVYGGASGINANHRATILLYDRNSNCVGSIKFYDPGTPLPNDFERHGTIRMFLSSAMFVNVVDVLRNEKPVFIHADPKQFYISTDKEPIGEEENN